MNKTPLLFHLNRLLIICGLIIVSPTSATQNIDKIYVSMPNKLHANMSKEKRLELVEYHKAGSKDTMLNRFGNKVFIQKLDTLNQLLKIQSTKSTIIEIKLFHLEDETPAIGLIRTVCGPVCHSMVQFYDTAWNPIQLKFIMPKTTEWLNTDSLNAATIDKKWVLKQLDDSFVSLSFDVQGLAIVANTGILDFLSDDIRPAIAPFISDKSIQFTLSGKEWIKRNP